MGNFSIYEVELLLLVLLVAAAVPIILIVWAVRTLGGSRQREAEMRRRIEALEAERHAPRSGAT